MGLGPFRQSLARTLVAGDLRLCTLLSPSSDFVPLSPGCARDASCCNRDLGASEEKVSNIDPDSSFRLVQEATEFQLSH